MDDKLLNRDEVGFDEWTVTPEPSDLVPDSIARQRDRESFREQLAGGLDTVVVSHTDADGLTSAALLSAIAPTDETAIQTVGYQAPYRFEHVLEDLIHGPDGFDPSGTRLLVADFVPNDTGQVESLGVLTDRGCHIEWYDHHQWSDDLRTAVENAGVDLFVNTDECAASLIYRYWNAHDDGPFDDTIEDLVAVTKDIDLWIRDDPRSPRLNTFASVVNSPERYIETVLEHGVDFPETVEEQIDERMERDEELETAAVRRAESHRIGNFDIAITYTRGGRTSNIGNELVENHDPLYDLAVVCTPESVSFYSHSENGTFEHCHDVAGELGGGGHPTAAGCGVPADTFRELAAYWAQACIGSRVETKILNVIGSVAQ